MNFEKPMPLLLIEDDVAECVKFKDCSNRRTDITFVGMTGSSIEGMQLVKSRLPEGIILDLELNKGKGSGLQFLDDLKDVELARHPIVVVTTNSPAEVVYNHVHDNGAALVFYKRKPDYSPDMVLNHLLVLRKSLYAMSGELPDALQSLETPEERWERISKRIETELDLIGMSPKYKGRKHFHEAIELLISIDKGESESVINQVAAAHKTSYSAIIRTMQTAINDAWKSCAVEDLHTHYTARIDIRIGVPSPTEFIHFYADKIRKVM
jgi:ActR/RegA family two-component response regulator